MLAFLTILFLKVLFYALYSFAYIWNKVRWGRIFSFPHQVFAVCEIILLLFIVTSYYYLFYFKIWIKKDWFNNNELTACRNLRQTLSLCKRCCLRQILSTLLLLILQSFLVMSRKWFFSNSDNWRTGCIGSYWNTWIASSPSGHNIK